jgi:hypothetical protein
MCSMRLTTYYPIPEEIWDYLATVSTRRLTNMTWASSTSATLPIFWLLACTRLEHDCNPKCPSSLVLLTPARRKLFLQLQPRWLITFSLLQRLQGRKKSARNLITSPKDMNNINKRNTLISTILIPIYFCLLEAHEISESTNWMQPTALQSSPVRYAYACAWSCNHRTWTVNCSKAYRKYKTHGLCRRS